MKERTGSVLIIVLIMMAISSALTLYVLRLSKEILQDAEGIMEKLQCKLEAKSLFEEIKYIASVSSFNASSIKNGTTLRDFPEELQNPLFPLSGL